MNRYKMPAEHTECTFVATAEQAERAHALALPHAKDTPPRPCRFAVERNTAKLACSQTCYLTVDGQVVKRALPQFPEK